MKQYAIRIPLCMVVGIALTVPGCRSTGAGASGPASAPDANSRAVAQRLARTSGRPVQRVVCLYTQRPWLNLDKAGDRDPEGIQYKVFLVARGGTRGELRVGTFHIEMYRVDRNENGELRRELVSDWHYTSGEVPVIAEPGMLGEGYHLHLRWAAKELAGSEIEIITMFEQPNGNAIRSGTKRLRIPKYRS